MKSKPFNTPPGADAPQPARSGWLGTTVLACLIFGGLALFIRSQERGAIEASAVDDRMTPGGTIRPEAMVSRAVRASRLVTVVLETTVTAQSVSSSWRGDAVAQVRAPVRLMFGTDLSNLAEGAVRVDPFGGAMVVNVPRPSRMATEVLGDGERSEVSVGWLRLRSIAGEYQLGLARKGLYEAARTMTLRDADARLVEEATREQVTALVKAIAGERTAVEVRFIDAATAGAGVGDRGEAVP
jgi:hypothetical protein